MAEAFWKKALQNLTLSRFFVEFLSMDSIVTTGMAGIARGMENAARHTSEVTQSFQTSSPVDPVQPLTELERDRTQVEASTKVVQVGRSLSQYVLDLFA